MTGAPLEGAHDRPDFVRGGAQRCWIDGDLIRLWTSPIGGIRPNGRRPPIPWLIDLSVLEQAMQSVYGRGFRLGDRIPVLQMAVDAMAAGDRAYAAELVDAVAFPEPEYFSTFRNACVQYLSWGPAHRRGNPRIDVDAWRSRKQLERKFDPNQPRVPRGHSDGGQWTDGSGPGGDASERNGDTERTNAGETLLTDEEHERVVELEEEIRIVLAERGDPAALLVLVARRKKGQPSTLEKIKELAGPLSEALLSLLQEGPLYRFIALYKMAESVLPDIFGYMEEAEELEDLIAESDYQDFASPEEFKEFYKSKKIPGRDWHHIVEKDAGFPRNGLGNKKNPLHSTENMVQIPRAKHWEITQYYSKPNREPPFLGLSPREWLRGQTWEAQYEFGIATLKKFKVLK